MLDFCVRERVRSRRAFQFLIFSWRAASLPHVCRGATLQKLTERRDRGRADENPQVTDAGGIMRFGGDDPWDGRVYCS
jgi:hypothetical protein